MVVVMPRTASAHVVLSEQVGSSSIWTWSRSDPLDASHRSFINHNQLSIRNQVVLRSLDAYHRCAADAVVGWGPQLSPRGGQVSSGVLIGRPDAHFYASWRRRLLRGYDAGRTDFGRSCALGMWTGMAKERGVLIHPQGWGHRQRVHRAGSLTAAPSCTWWRPSFVSRSVRAHGEL